MSGVNIIQGSVYTTSLNVNSNVSVGGNVTIGGNVSVAGTLTANNVTVNPTTLNLTSTDNSITVSGSVATYEISVNVPETLSAILVGVGPIVSHVNGLLGDITLGSLGSTVSITVTGNTINFETISGGAAPGSNYSDYLFWNPATGTYAVGSQNVHIGTNAALTSQGAGSVAIGSNAGQTTQGSGSVAVGSGAASTTQGSNSVAIGLNAGNTTQGISNVAIGMNAGQINQRNNAVAVGSSAGATNQNSNTTSIGFSAGTSNQSVGATAVGSGAGFSNQGSATVAVGSNAGRTSQGTGAVAIGNAAGQTTQGANSIAIGSGAGFLNQPANSIVLNATGTSLNPVTSGFFVNPVRSIASSLTLVYNPSTSEIGYNTTLGTSNWANFKATSNVDLNGNYIFSSTGGGVTLQGNTVLVGSTTICESLGAILQISNDANISVAGYIASGYDRVKIQTWGAGGGNGCNITEVANTNVGGAGGYTECMLNLSSASYISISVGGAGPNPPIGSSSGAQGGNYGGAPGSCNALGNPATPGLGGAGGGGATIVRTNNGIVTIAGGGGGGGSSTAQSYGGNAGVVGLPGYSVTGGAGGGSSMGTGGTGGSRSGFFSGNNGGTGVVTPTSFQGGGPSLPTIGYTGGGGGGAGWGGGGGGTATAGGGGGSSYIRPSPFVISSSNFAPSAVYGQPSYTDPTFTNVASNGLSGGVILTFFNSAVNQLAPALTVTNSAIRAPEFNSTTQLTPFLPSNISSNLTVPLNTPGVYQCFSYSSDSNAYMATSVISVNFLGNAFLTTTVSVPAPGLTVSICGASTYNIKNDTSVPGTDLSNIITKYTKLG
uniref:receptor protein-tyrosine kinase n=1 Tax=viral metagenome TaxID=1070528 RepID=A0A6C0I7Q3_9ZZZZ